MSREGSPEEMVMAQKGCRDSCQSAAWEEGAQNHLSAVKVRMASPRACLTPTPLSIPQMRSGRPVL